MKADTEKRLGQLIRDRRKARKMKLRELGAAAGMDVSQLSKVERGLCRTSLDAYERIAVALGWRPSALWREVSAHSPGGKAA